MEGKGKEIDAYDVELSNEYDQKMRHFNILDYGASHFRHFADRFNGASVLEFGCGSGAFLETALRGGAAKVYGIDVSNEMLAITKSFFAERDLVVDVRQGDCF